MFASSETTFDLIIWFLVGNVRLGSHGNWEPLLGGINEEEVYEEGKKQGHEMTLGECWLPD